MVTKLELATSSAEFPKGDSTCMHDVVQCTYIYFVQCFTAREQILIYSYIVLDIAVFYTAYFVHSGDITACIYL